MLKYNANLARWGELRKKRLLHARMGPQPDRADIEAKLATVLEKRGNIGELLLRKLLMGGKLSENIVMWTGVVRNEPYILNVVLEWSTENVIIRSLVPLLREVLFKSYCGSVGEYMKDEFTGISRIESYDICNNIIAFCGAEMIPELRLVCRSVYVAASLFYSEQRYSCSVGKNDDMTTNQILQNIIRFILSKENPKLRRPGDLKRTLPRLMVSSIVPIYGHILLITQTVINDLPVSENGHAATLDSICDTFQLGGGYASIIETFGEILYSEEGGPHMTVLVDNVLRRYEALIIDSILTLTCETTGRIVIPERDTEVLCRILGAFCRIGNTQFFIEILQSDIEMWSNFFIELGMLNILIHSGKNPTLVSILSAALFVGSPELSDAVINAFEGQLDISTVDSANCTPVHYWAKGNFHKEVVSSILPILSPICLLKMPNPETEAPLSLLLQRVRRCSFEGDVVEVLTRLSPFLKKTSYPLYWCFQGIHNLRNKSNATKNLEIIRKMFEYFVSIGCKDASMPPDFVEAHLPLSIVAISECCSQESCLMYASDHLLGTAHCPALKDMSEFRSRLTDTSIGATPQQGDDTDDDEPVDNWELLAE
eukprot:TRINITY_DN1639_c0_g3_i1.p1 TRINITY_DN1639_c0_g3~~TRINITY_DN1639_c0_g3_i1.p1  ORF type:complete len:599 (+),score=84.89 TRINITY_DN1639_c0_g3_i1:56-1852(+)